MARITVEDCLNKVENRFLLVNMVAKRVRQIREGSEYLVNSPKNEDIVVSLREIAAGKIILKTENDNENIEIEEQQEELPEPEDNAAEVEDTEEPEKDEVTEKE